MECKSAAWLSKMPSSFCSKAFARSANALSKSFLARSDSAPYLVSAAAQRSSQPSSPSCSWSSLAWLESRASLMSWAYFAARSSSGALDSWACPGRRLLSACACLRSKSSTPTFRTDSCLSRYEACSDSFPSRILVSSEIMPLSSLRCLLTRLPSSPCLLLTSSESASRSRLRVSSKSATRSCKATSPNSFALPVWLRPSMVAQHCSHLCTLACSWSSFVLVAPSAFAV
mmetsp:Transcript_100117/g.278957  ORF Transcript_100117/g.278957 Transcript_100117/m.278957 type:complete len:229 (-) Transcript_100117:664-1350(-)